MDGLDGDDDLPGADAVEGLLAGGLTARLERWAGEARVDEAARRRSRERWLLQAAEEGGTLRGVLTDLAERRVPLTVRTGAGRHQSGRVRVVGADFVTLDASGGGEVIVALAAIASLRVRPGHAPTAGDRPVRSDLRLAEVLAGLAADRSWALVVTLDGDGVAGTLRAMGRDVLTVRADGESASAAAATTAYVPLAAVGEVVVGP